MEAAKERNFGLDFLRILSMLMIVQLHVLGYGGILNNAVEGSIKYWVSWFLEIAAYCAVNCYAIVSGYVSCNSKAKISRITELWFQTIFYTIGITLIMCFFFNSPLSIKNVVNAVFPITRKQYWYISAYFALYIFIPLLNNIIKYTNKSTYTVVLIAIFIAFSCLPTVLLSDPYSMVAGYSAIWLMVLYLLGGYFKKYKIQPKNRKGGVFLFLYFVCIFITFMTKYVLELLNIKQISRMFITYTSPTIVLAAVFLFLYCSNLKFLKSKNIIKLFAPATLGVYIIHVNPLIWTTFIKDFAVPFQEDNIVIMFLKICGSVLVIYIVCSIIDIIRIRLFKVIKMGVVCLKIENMFIKVYNKFAIKETT